MTDAPERIWAEPSKYPGEWTATEENITVFDVEYIRADLSQAAVEALEAKLAKAVETLKRYGGVMPVAFTPIQDGGYKARTTLAELTGGKDD